METLAIFLLTTFCAGAAAWVLLYPYLSGEKEAEKRMLSVAKPGPASAKVNARAVWTRREQVETTLKEVEERRKKSNSPPLSVRLTQAGLTWSKQQFYIVSAVFGAIVFAGGDIGRCRPDPGDAARICRRLRPAALGAVLPEETARGEVP